MCKHLLPVLLILCFFSNTIRANDESQKWLAEKIASAKTQFSEQNTEAAFAGLQAALEECRKRWPDDQLSISGIHHQIGVFHYILQAYEDALPYFEKALVIREKQLTTNHLDQIKSRFALALSYRQMKRYTKALEYILPVEQAVTADTSLHYPKPGNLYYELGIIYRELGDFQQADDYLRKSNAFFKDHLLKLARGYTDLGILYDDWKRYEQSLAHLNQSLDLYRQAPDGMAKALGLINGYFDLGTTYISVPNYQKALEMLDRAEDLYRNQFDPEEYPEFLCDIFHNKSLVYKRKKEYGIALQLAQQAIDGLIEDSIPKHDPRLAIFYDNFGDIYRSMNQLKKALSYYQQAIFCYVPGFKDDRIHAHPVIGRQMIHNAPDLFTSLSSKARTLQALYNQEQTLSNLKAAYKAYLALDTLVTQMRQEYSADASKFFHSEEAYPVYEAAIGTALELYDQTGDSRYKDAAWLFAEKSKAVVLYEAVRKASKEQQLEHTYPDILMPEDIQKKLPESSALLEYVLGDRTVYIFAITSGSFAIKAIPRSVAFDRTCHSYRQSLSDWSAINQSRKTTEQAYLQSAQELYTLLLKPIAPELVPSVQRLIIVPDGLLGLLSFEALLYEPVTGWKDKNAPWLVRRYALSYAWSATLLFSDLYENHTAPKTSYPFGGFGLNYKDFDFSCLPQKVNAPPPGQLPFAPQEVEQISTLWSGKNWLNQEATKANFQTYAPKCDILHLAMHAIVSDEKLSPSYLLFSDHRNCKDLMLTESEIYKMALPARMVSLSACNTGYGNIQRGEGIISLSRAFARAGVPAMTMGLWNLADETSAILMADFYRQLKTGLPKDMALQQAKLNYLETASPERLLPAYWSGTVLIGNSSPMQSGSRGLHWPWILTGLLLFTAILFFGRRKKSVL